jgi:phosphatidylinositol alpha-1,6-mannosyltransferase
VVGTGQDRDRLVRLARQLGVWRSVRFYGAVSEDEKAALLRACDVFLLPSRSEPGEVEGFGIVLVEAGAFGKPAIAGRNGGTSDAILSGKTGFLVDATEGSELSAAVTRLLDDSVLAQQMGSAGRARFWAEFAWDVAVQRFEAAILGP